MSFGIWACRTAPWHWGLTARWTNSRPRRRNFRPIPSPSPMNPRWIGSRNCSGIGGPRIFAGESGLVDLARHEDVDIVVAAVVGAAGLPAALAAVRAGKTLALANKEALVVAGSLLIPEARKRGVRVLPVDSEHSAIFQAMASGRSHEVRRVILTASGGPFRHASLEKIRNATPADALNHPTWRMGNKITIDSATMFNKALELIEACWLFDLRPDQVQIVIHPNRSSIPWWSSSMAR